MQTIQKVVEKLQNQDIRNEKLEEYEEIQRSRRNSALECSGINYALKVILNFDFNKILLRI